MLQGLHGQITPRGLDSYEPPVQGKPLESLVLLYGLREPTETRGNWFKENPPSAVVVLPRATYRDRQCISPEAWFVWHIGGGADVKPISQAFIFLRYRRVHRGVFS